MVEGVQPDATTQCFKLPSTFTRGSCVDITSLESFIIIRGKSEVAPPISRRKYC